MALNRFTLPLQGLPREGKDQLCCGEGKVGKGGMKSSIKVPGIKGYRNVYQVDTGKNGREEHF